VAEVQILAKVKKISPKDRKNFVTVTLLMVLKMLKHPISLYYTEQVVLYYVFPTTLKIVMKLRQICKRAKAGYFL